MWDIASASLALALVAQFGSCVATSTDGTYDYIIVGAGVSGLVVANRLSENAKNSVLVIERGDFDDKPEAIVPWYANLMDTSVMIRPESAPNPKLKNATYPVPVAAVVGGGSVVNGMGYTRASRLDYDGWEELGNPGWGWDGLFPYFRKSTTFIPPSPATVNNFNVTWNPSAYGCGPVHIHIPSFQYPDLAAFWEALRSQEDVEFPLGIDSGAGPGAAWAASTIDARDMTRTTSRKAYYDPVKATRPNLHLLTGQTATKILFRQDTPLTAEGIRIVSRLDGITRDVYAKKEVILATGAIQTPHLLQVSGIGPSRVLEAAGIEVRKDLEAVGANFQDHATALLGFGLTNTSFPNTDSILANETYNATVWEEYLKNKTGPIAAGASSTVLFLSLPQLNSSAFAAAIVAKLLAQDSKLYLPDIYASSQSLLRGFEAQRQILAKQLNSTESRIVSHPITSGGFHPSALLKPISRGTVTLDIADPNGLPVVQFNTLMNPIDSENVAAIVRRARKFWESAELSRFKPTELFPGVEHQTDEGIIEALTSNPAIFWPSLAHTSGTCAMMPQELGGCVSPNLLVYGVRGLSVVDASIMPIIPAGALQATVYAVAEKAADLIKARAHA